jgi:hypothetical protein
MCVCVCVCVFRFREFCFGVSADYSFLLFLLRSSGVLKDLLGLFPSVYF